MELTDCFRGIEDVFNPKPAYKGDYIIPLSILVNVAIKEGNKNKVKEFFNLNYYDKLDNTFLRLHILDSIPLDLLSMKVGNQRTLKISSASFVMTMLWNITYEKIFITENISDDEIKDIAINYTRSYRKKLIDFEKNGENAEAYEQILDVYKEDCLFMKQIYGNRYQPLSMPEFIDKKKEQLSCFATNLKYALEYISKPINLKELEKCLNLEDFYFVMAKTLLELSQNVEEETGKLHSSFCYVDKYILFVQEIRKTRRYNKHIQTKDPISHKKIRYSTDHLIKEYTDMRVRHPEYHVVLLDIPTDEIIRREKDGTLESYVDQLVKIKSLQASWNFVSKGENTQKVENLNPTNQQTEGSTKNISRSTKDKNSVELKYQYEMIKRRAILDSSNYLYQLMGKNHFEGYVGYLYANGNVIFEKFYENIKKHKIAKSHATYIMTLDNFVEMSKRTKSEIIQYIESGNTDVKRIYHTQTWQHRIENAIKTKEYSEEIIQEIDLLIQSQTFTKRKIYE
ncbi:MAG: hypothetical protein J6B89_03265 [Bacilli bacterium]|nr:hypothetical protein [Bacilli bacterium]